MRVFSFLIAALGLISATIASAQEASPELQVATDAWLSDDDATALPALSALAASGDQSAAIMLGRIERMTPKPAESPWLASLSSADRAALFAPTGAPLLDALAGGGDALAEMLLAADGPEATIETAHTLHAFGEVERARHLAWTMLEAGKLAEVVTMPQEEPLYRDLDWLWWMRGWMAGGANSGQPENWVLVSEAKGRAAGIIFANWAAQFIAAKTPLTEELQRVASALDGKPAALVAAGPEEVAYAEKLVAGLARRDPAMRPLAAVCNTACGEELGACMLEGLRVLGGYGALMPLDTPLEPVISQSAYTTSAKAAANVRRMIAAASPAAPGEPVNQCLASAVGG
ncbi:MAG: hypothetical protein AAFN79_17360 [Pseudomonadota bacterium]